VSCRRAINRGAVEVISTSANTTTAGVAGVCVAQGRGEKPACGDAKLKESQLLQITTEQLRMAAST